MTIAVIEFHLVRKRTTRSEVVPVPYQGRDVFCRYSLMQERRRRNTGYIFLLIIHTRRTLGLPDGRSFLGLGQELEVFQRLIKLYAGYHRRLPPLLHLLRRA
jgi:hypothetical protein